MSVNRLCSGTSAKALMNICNSNSAQPFNALLFKKMKNRKELQGKL
jgi:hypothetical protein